MKHTGIIAVATTAIFLLAGIVFALTKHNQAKSSNKEVSIPIV